MPRLSPRVKVALPVCLESKSGKLEMLISDIGMNGAFIKSESSAVPKQMGLHTSVTVHCNINKSGILANARIVRNNTKGYAVAFCGIGRKEKKILWGYIFAKMLLGTNDCCPYCNERFGAKTKTCQKCGWDLTFSSQDYFDYYEKTSMIRKINDRITDLKLDQLYSIEQLIDVTAPITTEASHQSEEDQEFIGTCSAMLEVFKLIRKVAPTDISVLIMGESGTGKELTAQAIHERSARKDSPFVAINCGAIPENLLESELFGHEKGAFTGAYAVKKGKFEYADGGTIFLDEIGEMPLALQVKLLRFLQDRNVERVGSVSARKVDLRVIAATNCDLKSSISEGKFRSDLFYRLNEFIINMPAIRERGTDKIILARSYLDKFCREKGVLKTFSPEAVTAIMSYEWPGNVREIINKVRRAMVMGGEGVITVKDLDLDASVASKSGDEVRLSDALAEVEKDRISEALRSCNNNISAAAGSLGITRQTLHRRIKLLGIKKVAELLL